MPRGPNGYRWAKKPSILADLQALCGTGAGLGAAATALCHGAWKRSGERSKVSSSDTSEDRARRSETASRTKC